MRITLPVGSLAKNARRTFLQIPRERAWEWVGLCAVVLLAAGLLFYHLDAIGYGNTYYTAAVKAMLQSWHNFFFVAAEPGGSVTVDKPPVGLWLETISAYFLGVNGFAVVLPQILAGIGSVILLYHLVRRKFSAISGLLAGLALAITPVAVATERNNTIDSTLIFTLLLAAWAFIKATESRRLRYLLLGAFLVGIGFNIKMLEAYLPLPAFYAMYFLGSAETIRHKLGKLAVASLLLVVVSFSWATAVDLTPASQRPYVGSSGDNSEFSLIFGYNGIDRLLGMMGVRRTNQATNLDAGSQPQPSGSFGSPTNPGQRVNPNDGRSQPPAFGLDDGSGARPDGTFNPPGQGGGGFNIGQAGALRLFTTPLSKEISWLLPFGIIAALLVIFRKRLRWPIDADHQAVVLWGGWLLTGGIFFSIAGFFHQYYLATLAPPLAALVAIGASGLWQLHKERPWLAFGLLLASAGGTLVFQVSTAHSFTSNTWWLLLAYGLLILGGLSLLVGMIAKLPRGRAAGFVCIMAAVLVTPGIWSGLTTLNTGNQVLPESYSGTSTSFGGSSGTGLQVNQVLLTYLEANTQGMRYMLAVPSSNQGAGYVLASGRGVLYMGGFNGQDQVVTGSDLANLVNTGQLRYILLDGGSGFGGNSQSSITAWVTSTCTTIQNISGSSSEVGPSSSQSGGFSRAGNNQGNLYDCSPS